MPRTLREMRVQAGLTLRALSDLSGVAAPVVSQIERGRIVAEPHEAAKIASALGLPDGSLVLRTTLVYEEPDR